MKISVITATYNASATLGEAAESLFRQSYPHIEYIIVDGGSTDATIGMVKSFGDRVDQFISESDRGIFDALNKGMALSTGEYVGFLHADDLLAHPEVIENMVSRIKRTSADAIYGDLQYVSRNNPRKVIRHWKSKPWSPELLHKGWMPPHPTLFIHKLLYLKHGAYDLRYGVSSDYDFVVRLFSDPDIHFAYLPEVMVKMRMGGNSNGSLRRIVQKSREDLRIMKSHRFPHPFSTLINKNLSKTSQFLPNRQEKQ